MTQQIPNFPGVAVIADDLTSAADGSSPFLHKGFDVEVIRWKAATAEPPFADAVAIDCGSRSLASQRAAKIAGEVTAALCRAPLLVKTIDSTLRGHIREELQAVWAQSGRRRMVIAPAFPEAGRTTQNGVQYVDGIPVAESSYGRDPVHPARTSRIADLVPEAVSSLTILDANSQQELTRKVAAIECPEDVLWVGSPGLALALGKLQSPRQKATSLVASAALTLVVVGSANPLSRDQLRYAGKSSAAICVSVSEGRVADPKELLAEIADQASQCLEDPAIGALLATGGDTMEAVLETLNIARFRLVGEVETGFPLGVTTLASGRRLFLGLKAGGFGDPDTLHKAAETFRQTALAQEEGLT